jgi:flagellar basal-body rod protein FlgB
LLFSNAIQSLERGLDYSAARNRAISNNIANVDTPGYKAQRVSFEEHLQTASNLQAQKSDERHISFKGPQKSFIDFPGGSSYQHNGNGVDIDYEMAELAKNQIYYHANTDLLKSKFTGLKQSIGSGR